MLKNHYTLFFFCIFFVLIKIISIALTDFNLYGDEAQYWLWSKELSFGYYSKPPLLSWFIRLITFVFGDSFFVLKTIPITLYCVTSYLIFIFTKKLFNDVSLAFCCALTFFLLPSVSLSSFLLSTDILLILFWTLGLIQVLKIKQNPSYFNYIILGLILGLAFLSKYAAIYFIISLILLVVKEKEFRLVFFQSKSKLFLSSLIIILILLPNIFWNYENNWSTLGHTADNVSLDKIRLNLFGFFKFLFSQIGMVGPVLVIGFLLCSYKQIKIDANERFLIIFAFPALLIVLIESFLVRAHANWAAVSLVSLSIFFVSTIYKLNKKVIYLNNYINLFVGSMLFVMIGFGSPLNAFNRINGIKDLVLFLDEKNNNNINNIVVNDRLLFANLSYAYYSKQINFYSPFTPGEKIAHHFQLKKALPVNFNQNFILIGNKDDIGYLQKEKQIILLGSKSFPFADRDLKIYEIIID